MIRCSVESDVFKDATWAEIEAAIGERLEDVARVVLEEAERTKEFKDFRIVLRPSIKKSKARYGTGYLVFALAPHAHLVEFGHAQWIGGTLVKGYVRPHPFLRRALRAGIKYALQRYRDDKASA